MSSTPSDTPSTEEPTPRGTGDAAEAEQRLEDRTEAQETAATGKAADADAIEALKKRTHPFD